MQRWAGFWGPALTLFVLAGVVASVFGARAVAAGDRAASQRTFDAQAVDIAATLKLALRQEADLVTSASAFAANTGALSQARFQRWTRSQQAFERYPELQALGLAVAVPRAQLAAFAQKLAADPPTQLGPRGTIAIVPSGERPFYCLIQVLVRRPGTPPLAAGTDYCSPTQGVSALPKSYMFSQSFETVHWGSIDGLLVSTPVYRAGLSLATAVDRRRAFVGISGASLSPDIVLARALQSHRAEMGLSLSHGPGTVFRAGVAPDGAATRTIPLGDGWRARIAGTVNSGDVFANLDAVAVLVGGIVLTLLAALLQLSRRRRSLAKIDERVARESEDKLRSLLQNASDAIVVVDQDGRVLYQAGSVEPVLGLGPGELEGRNIADVVDLEEAGHMLSLCHTIDAGEAELHLHHVDGTVRTCEVRATGLLDHPAWHGVVLVIRDISDRKRLEIELRLAQKLESVGELAAGIAHEINTPVQYVTSSVQFLDRAFKDLTALQEVYGELIEAVAAGTVDEDLLAQVAEAEDAADLQYLRKRVPDALVRCFTGLERVAEIVGAMRTFAHPPTTTATLVDINDAIRTTLTVAHNEYKYVADLQSELGELPPILGNAGDLNQVLINLIVNASHAIGDVVGDSGHRGMIRVRTFTDGGDVVIEIADTGGGIPEEIADRVFDPFFTTKEIGRGTGQGLAISRTIIEHHHGRLSFESQPGLGTTFTIRLPIDTAGAAPEPLVDAA